MLVLMIGVACALSLFSIVMQLTAHARWSAWADEQARDTRRLWAAHHRMGSDIYRRSSTPPEPSVAERVSSPMPAWVGAEPFDLERRADWSDDRTKTRKLDGKHTYLPVDFRHDLW